jgi:two-component system response regulator HydG
LRTGPLIAVHCASLSESLIESELFGHARGAYTGASSDRKGRFEDAHTGTLFLDEVSEIPRDIQVKLLRVLQEREVTRVGESRARPIDVRIISASNRDLKAEVAAGRFREDLYFRINVVRVLVPPLRERKGDIPALAEAFLHEKCQINERDVRAVSPLAMDLLLAYDWPGNVRELENVIENGVVMTRTSEITPELLPLDVQLAGHGIDPERATAPAGHTTAVVTQDGGRGGEGAITIPIGTPLENVEREMILRTLSAVDGNKTTAARILGLGARTLYRKLEQYGEHTRNPDGENDSDDDIETED